MRKQDADNLKKTFGVKHHYEDPLRHISQDDLRTSLTLLNQIQAELDRKIADFALDATADLWDPETSQIIRVYWFSRGMKDYYLCLDGTGLIRMIDLQMPQRLFDLTMEVLDTFYD